MYKQQWWQKWMVNGLAALIILLLAQRGLSARPTSPACSANLSIRQRIGINVVREGNKRITDYAVAQLGAGWYLDYQWNKTPARPANMAYGQMIRPWRITHAWKEQIGAVIDVNRGALWLLGNEPDNIYQDKQTPAEYAVFYHDTYDFLKRRDPTSRVAIAGIATVTPLRLRYLDMVLRAYQARYGTALPVDVWNMHGYILPETDGWGAGIPPGLANFAREGRRYTLDDQDNLAIFQAQIWSMRRWMADRGYRDKPLLVSEFGILLAPIYGYSHARVRNFMWASFDYLLSATDPATGYPADNNRLVQQFAWFSLNDYAYDAVTGRGLNGNLFDHDSGRITQLGHDFTAYSHCLN
jgi:hypothetical protein